MVKTAYSTCPHDCPSACAVEVTIEDDGRIGRLRGAKDQRYTAGVICEKVARYRERTHNPGRLLSPMIRRGHKGSGEFEPVSWETALDDIAEAFIKIEQSHGPEAIWPYHYAGTMGVVQRNSINALRHVKGYSNQDFTICSAIADAGWTAGYGDSNSVDPSTELEDSDLIIVWGSNPVVTQVNLMTHIAKAKKKRGAKLVVIDPYRTETALKADLHIKLRPGTDGALACAIMHVLFKEGYADRDYLAKYARGWEKLEAHLADKTPDWAEEITGVSCWDIEALARDYGATEGAFLRLGMGFTRSRNGAVNFHAASCLPIVGGKWGKKGGGAYYSTGNWFKVKNGIVTASDKAKPGVRTIDMCQFGAALIGDEQALNGGPPVHGLFVQSANPFTVTPDGNKGQVGMAREDLFTVVHEQYMSETATMADILLPATTFLEHDDVLKSYGNSFLQAAPKVIEPLGLARSNHWVVSQLAERLGVADKHFTFTMTDSEVIEAVLQASGYGSFSDLKHARWLDQAVSWDEQHNLGGFKTSDGKFHCDPDWDALGNGEGMPALPDHWEVIEGYDPKHPFRLITPPARTFLNSSFTDTATSRAKEGVPTLKISPVDATIYGIKRDDLVMIGNERGKVILTAEVTDDTSRGVLVAEGIWPNAAHPGGKGINTLIGDTQVQPAGGGAFHDCHVFLEPVHL